MLRTNPVFTKVHIKMYLKYTSFKTSNAGILVIISIMFTKIPHVVYILEYIT